MCMKIGIIGTGWVADLHLNAFKQIENAEVVAIAGRNTDRAQELAQPFGAAVYADHLSMLKNESLDVVAILLPPHLHGDLERACSEYVKGVLIEKPITQSMETAHTVNAHFKTAGTIVSVGYMNRYRQSVQTARELFQQPGNSAIMANGWWMSEMPPPMWWRNFNHSGGQFVEQCTHLVDACRYVMGDVVEVSAYRTSGYMNEVADYSVDDGMVVNARFASGALGSFSTACFSLAGHPETSGIHLSLSSRQNRMVLEGWNLEGTLYAEADQQTKLPVEQEIFVVQNQAFLDAVATGDRSLIRSDYEDGMKTLAVTLAANESAREKNGAPVSVAF